MENPLLEAALDYARKGWKVFPVMPNEKRPLIKEWQNKCSADEAVIREWWARYPNANIGLVTGKTSNLYAVDVDAKGAVDGMETLEAIELAFGPLDTLRSITQSGGRHLLFNYPIKATRNKVSALPGIDIRSDNGYIIAPPSIVNGKCYVWEDESLKIADLPLLLMPVFQHGADVLPPTNIIEGQRNEAIFKYSCKLRNLRVEEETAKALVLNAAYLCSPPLSKLEALSCLESAEKYKDSHQVESNIVYRCMSDIEPQPILWLWEGHIARGKVSLIAGNPGRGKSQITISMASIVSNGGAWPTGQYKAPVGNVVFLSAEDDAADTIKPRLMAVDADVSKVFVIEATAITNGKASTIRSFNLKDDLSKLEEMVEKIGGASLLIIDPISAYLGDTDSHKNADVRSLLAPLSDFANRHNIAVVCVSHLNKSTDREALHRVTGSLAFVAAARAVYVVLDDQSNPEQRLFLPAKNNIGNDRNGYTFRVEGLHVGNNIKTSRIVWGNECIDMSADEAMKVVDNDTQSALTEAKDFLLDLLSSGGLTTKEVMKNARDAGHATQTIRRAQKALGIRPKKSTGPNGAWVWSLPDDSQHAQDDQPAQHQFALPPNKKDPEEPDW